MVKSVTCSHPLKEKKVEKKNAKRKKGKFVTTRKEVYKEKTKTSNRDIKKFVLINKKLYIKITIETIKVIRL